MSNLLTSAEVEARLRVARATLTYWRATDQGPPWVRLGKSTIRYREDGLAEWLATQEHGGAAPKPAA